MNDEYCNLLIWCSSQLMYLLTVLYLPAAKAGCVQKAYSRSFFRIDLIIDLKNFQFFKSIIKSIHLDFFLVRPLCEA
jgi:hypothetical protein